MTIDVQKMNDLIAQIEKTSMLLYSAKLDLTNDDFDSFVQHYGDYLQNADLMADMKSKLLG